MYRSLFPLQIKVLDEAKLAKIAVIENEMASDYQSIEKEYEEKMKVVQAKIVQQP